MFLIDSKPDTTSRKEAEADRRRAVDTANTAIAEAALIAPTDIRNALYRLVEEDRKFKQKGWTKEQSDSWWSKMRDQLNKLSYAMHADLDETD